MTPFAFLSTEWPDVHQAAAKAWQLALPEPRTACFYARRALELCVEWLYTADASLKKPYSDNISARIHEPTFKGLAGNALFLKARLIIATGNHAVHRKAPVTLDQAATAVSELFHLTYWVARNYARGARPDPALQFRKGDLPNELPPSRTTQAQLQRLAADNQQKDEEARLAREENAALKEELAALRAEVELAKKKAAEVPDTHDYSEAETRREYIDLLLREAGWPLANPEDREFEVHGMPNAMQVGYVDYVLWGDDGKPLGLVEAKRTSKSAQQGQQQAKLYADCLEAQFGQRPLIFYTNGYETWLWDDTQSAPRAVQGFYTKAELDLCVQRRTSRKRLLDEKINDEIVNRHYQHHAVRRVCEAFEDDHDRKALLVMATGTGKTRTVIALCDVLMRANWVKRVLFLADRKVLVKQAVNAFKKHLPDTAPVNLLKDKQSEGRVYVATYPTIMGLIDRVDPAAGRRFGPGYFDLLVIDEAHRSVYEKYGAIFRYFDARLVGLTATPRGDVGHDTYRLFELEDGVPTDAFELADAIDQKVLVPSRAISVALKFPRQGIAYAELPKEERDRWDELEWDAEDGTPDHVDSAALNEWLMNIDTVDKVLAHLMERGQQVAAGDRLGKTIIFAKNQRHAEFIAKRFDANYPHFKGSFARVVHNKVDYVEALIEDFSTPNKEPHIAISVDMLDTGVDVPEVVNLVFFKRVRSKTKFWQMVGRGTRLCPDLFGPDQHKEFFYIFDYCENLEFFAMEVEHNDGSVGASLKQRLFVTRLQLLNQLDRPTLPDPARPFHGTGHPSLNLSADAYRGELAAGLSSEVAAMNVDNFVVRPQLRAVQRYADVANWSVLSDDDTSLLVRDVAHLPTELPPESEEAKRFDHLVYRLELGVLRVGHAAEQLVEQARTIASLLEEKASIPAVAAQLSLIEELQTDAYWEDITVPMLEHARRNLRSLVRLIEKKKRKIIYTDFADQFGEEAVVELPGFSRAEGFERFRAKLRTHLRMLKDHLTLHKLRTNKPLTQRDLDELEHMLVLSGAATEADLERAKAESEGLGLFIRSLVGLDRDAATEAFGALLAQKLWTAQQIRFVDMIIKHLTEHGVMKPELLYESPFTDMAPTGPDALFKDDEVLDIFEVLEQVRAAAVAS